MPMKTIEGYSKEKYTNTSVLLAGGGTKALSDFIGSLSWDSTNKKIKYTPVGGSATDLVTLSWDNIANKPTEFNPSSHEHTYIKSKDNYTFSSSTLPNSFDLGVSAGFVSDTSGFGSYGSVLTVRTYTGGGGSLQLYAPYSSTYGGSRLKARFGDYNSNSGNSWTTLKEIAWLEDIPTNNNQLTNGAGYITGITKKMVTDALGYTPPTTNTTYNFSGTSFTSGNSDNGEHNANNITSNGHWYYSSNGPATSLGASTADGALYSQAYSTSWVGQIAQDYRNGNLFTRGKNNGTWTDWKAVSYSGHTHSYLPLSGGTLTGTLGKSNNYIFKPNGGDFRTTSNVYDGAICISLPANIGNTMLSMWIDVYNYFTNTSFSVHVGGYTYNSNFSNSPFAMVYGASHKVRLTYDNGFKIYIGETGSTWHYPQISIRDVVLGFNQNYSNWNTDWSVSFVTSFPTINKEITRYAITTDNIKDQSVNFATSATNASNIRLRDDSANLEYRLSFGKYDSSYVSLYSSQYLTYNPYSGRLQLKGSKEHNSVNHGGSISFGDKDYLYMKEAKDDVLLQHYKGLVSDTQPIAIGFVGSCPSNSSASLVYNKSQPSAITVLCNRVSSGRFRVLITNNSGKPIIAHLQVTPVRNYAKYEFAFAYIEDFTMDTADGGMEIASGTTGSFYVRTGRIHCQGTWAAGDYVATGDTGGFTGVVYAMINEDLFTMPTTSW